MNPRDDDLHGAFAHLRREEAARTPGFHGFLESARRRAPRKRSMVAPLVLAALLAAVIFGQALQFFGRPRVQQARPAGGWSEPTAFLLQAPGSDLLSAVPVFTRTVPEIGPPAAPAQPSQSSRSRERNSRHA